MPGDEHDPLRRQPELGQELLDRGEDRVVAAAGAPARLLVGGEVLLGQRRRRRRCRWLRSAASLTAAPAIASSSSSAKNGSPSTLVSFASTRNSARMIFTSWPGVHLRDQHLAVRAHDLAGVRGQRVEVVQVRDGDLLAAGPHAPHRALDRAVGRAPAEHQQLGAVVVRRPPARGCRRRSPRPSRPAGASSARGSPAS